MGTTNQCETLQSMRSSNTRFRNCNFEIFDRNCIFEFPSTAPCIDSLALLLQMSQWTNELMSQWVCHINTHWISFFKTSKHLNVQFFTESVENVGHCPSVVRNKKEWIKCELDREKGNHENTHQ